MQQCGLCRDGIAVEITRNYKTNLAKPSRLCDLTFLSWSQDRFFMSD